MTDITQHDWCDTSLGRAEVSHGNVAIKSRHGGFGVELDADDSRTLAEHFGQLPKWRPISSLKQSDGAVTLYAPEWVDDDFNPCGVREGFRNEGDDGPIMCARWNDPCDRWETDDNCTATHWMPQPEPPE